MSRILLFLEFINEEFKKVKFDGSNTGRTKIVHNILDDPSNQKSYSSGILLRDKLRDQEFKDIMSDNDFDKMSKKERSRIRSIKHADGIKKSLNNLKFLEDQERLKGDLRCEYCNKGPLKIYKFDPFSKVRQRFDPINGATCDHREPTSKGGDPFDYKNLAVCCYGCNQKKGNMSWEDWRDRMSLS
jgi:hypothetical protein